MKNRITCSAAQRGGFILPLVLIVVAILSLAAYVFAEEMAAEYRVTKSLTSQTQDHFAARSLISYLSAYADEHRSSWNRRLLEAESVSLPGLRSRGSNLGLLVRVYDDVHAGLQIGLINESGKLNVNGLRLDEEHMIESRARLTAIPKMTPQIADAILDWLDSDAKPRPLGAEASAYTATHRSVLPRNESIDDLRELLSVEGVNLTLLFGEDANGNGWLDRNENDGAASWPPDDADGKLDRGWSAFLTTVAAESNLQADRSPKIHLNQSDASTMFDQLNGTLGKDAALFITALRLDGPMIEDDERKVEAEETIRELKKSGTSRLHEQLDSSGVQVRGKSQSLRDGLDVNRRASFVFRSLIDLVDRKVRTTIHGEQRVLISPWKSSDLDAVLADLEAKLTVASGDSLRHRINLQCADEIVLSTIPGLNKSQAAALVQVRAAHGDRCGLGMLLQRGTMDVELLRTVAPFLTLGGDVYSGTAVGTSRESNGGARILFVLDTTGKRAEIIFRREQTRVSRRALIQNQQRSGNPL